MEGRSEVIKQIESLKKLLQHEQTSEKATTEEVCSVISDLIKSITSTSHKPNSHAISNTIEVLVQACSNQSHVIRGTAAENLKRLIKKLMNTNFARIQQDLFHELKKDGEVKSICIVLNCFGSLFPLTRPLRCSSYAQSLVPVLVQLLNRKEEAVHEVLQEAFSKILPTLSPFMNISNLQAIMRTCLEHLSSASPSYRRMASTFYTEIGKYSKKSFGIFQWIITRLLDMCIASSASTSLVNSVLVILQQFFSGNCDLSIDLLKKCFCFIISCVLYKELNIAIAGLECLQYLLQTTNADFIHWLTSSITDGQMAQNFWSVEDLEKESSKSHFSSSENMMEQFCLIAEGDVKVPLHSLVKHLQSTVLRSGRVSAQSLGLTCISYSVDLMPSSITSVDPFLPFASAEDHKLRSSTAKLLASIIRSNLRIAEGGGEKELNKIVSVSFENLFNLISDETPVVLKSVCEALQLCLPSMVHSTMYNKVIIVVKKLVQLSDSPYWLTKVELLQTLRCLDFAVMSMQNQMLAKNIFEGIVLDLLDDSDYRVRSVSCECLVSLVRTFTQDENLELVNAKKESLQLFFRLDMANWSFGFNSITYKTSETMILPPLGLDCILWYLQAGLCSTERTFFQRGCLEALHTLSLCYPPTALPEEWGCLNTSSTLLKIFDQFLRSSKLAWSIQTHAYLLDVSSSLFLSCALNNLKKSSKPWGAIDEENLGYFAINFLNHSVKLLSIYVHVIDGREPELREKKHQAGIAPKIPGSDKLSPGKQKVTHGLPEPTSSKPRLVPRDGIGYFANSLHFIKLLEACKAAYTNYEISLDLPGTDQFSKLLISCHKAISSLLEVSLAWDIGKHVEEILFYLSYTVRIDSSGAYLCVQQLLNSLFGMNLGAQQTHIYSPLISSLGHNIGNVLRSRKNDKEESLHTVLVSHPLNIMKTSLNTTFSVSTRDYGEGGQMLSKEYTIPLKEALSIKPVNSVSDIKDYISYFEPLVVYALNQFPYTSSLILQERVLFLVIQLLQLKVRYDLLDCNHSFFETVMKLIGIMESGMVRGGEGLVPYLFQFLVLLSSDQSKLVTIPQVMQMCDGVMASGQNVTTFAIPALQPIVLYLFVRKTNLSKEVETQREVAVSMLLRLITNTRVLLLLIHVLDYYKEKSSMWNEVSNQIYQALLPGLVDLQLQLETEVGFVALYQLFMAMDLEVYDFEEMLRALFHNRSISSSVHFLRWLSAVFVILKLLGSKFAESTISKSLVFVVPEVQCQILMTEDSEKNSTHEYSSLADFVMETLSLSVLCLYKAYIKNCVADFDILSSLIVNILLLLQIFIPDQFKKLSQDLSNWANYESVSACFLKVSSFYPLLTLHYINLLFLVNIEAATSIMKKLMSCEGNLIYHTLQNTAVVSLCSHPDSFETILPLLTTFSYWKRSNVFSKFITCVKGKKDIPMSSSTDILPAKANASELLYYIQVFPHSDNHELLKYISINFLNHPLSALGKASKKMLFQAIMNRSTEFSSAVWSDFTESINSSGKFGKELMNDIRGSFEITLPLEDFQDDNAKDIRGNIDKEWYMTKVAEVCSFEKPEEKWKRVYLLSNMERDQIYDLFKHTTISSYMLEDCISLGLKLTLNSCSLIQHSENINSGYSLNGKPDYLHPLLEISLDELKLKLSNTPSGETLVRCCTRLLASYQEFGCEIFDIDWNILLKFSLTELKFSIDQNDHYTIQNCMTFCTLLLCNANNKELVFDEWTSDVINLVFCFVSRRLLSHSKLSARMTLIQDEKPINKLLFLLNLFVKRELVIMSPIFQNVLEMFIFSFCRLPNWHNLVITPPLLKKEEVVSDRVLDEALKESEVLKEYMQRCNSLGWLTKAQFEERWMQLLGVLNQTMPSLEHIEEFQAYCVNISAGLRAITSLLCGSMLNPKPGDPVSSVPIVSHRNPEMIFLGSRPGQRYMQVRKLIEQEIVFAFGTKKYVNDYFQYPSATCSSYSQLYKRNIERDIWCTEFRYSQISTKSLWPILTNQTSPGISISEEIDVKSCILSLMDLFVYWFTQPINQLMLKHVLCSVVILSDLFATSDQFKWMLTSFMEFYDHHPHEDSSIQSLLIVGILKATAVLKSSQSDSEGQIKIIENSLVDEVSIQIVCLQGILYLSDDPTNNVIVNCIPTLSKYILSSFKEYTSFSEDHLKLIWSVAVTLTRDYNQYIKEQDFIPSVLDRVICIMNDIYISHSLFQCFCYGLEFMILNFLLSSQEKSSISRFASNWFMKSEKCKSLSTLNLILLCLYTGQNILTGSEENISSETAIQAREQVNNLIEKLRNGSEICTDVLVDIIPQVITDFLSPMEVLQTVVTDFISPHQNRPEVSATILFETFLILMNEGQQALLNEWILLSIESFVQQEPEARAVWSITCLFLASLSNPVIRSMFPLVCYLEHISCNELSQILCVCIKTFCNQLGALSAVWLFNLAGRAPKRVEKQTKHQLLQKFRDSKYSSLSKVVDACK